MRHVLVTGASNGIGRATVAAFAAAGDRVVAGVRDPDSPGTGSIDRAGGRVEVTALDVRDDDAVARLAHRDAFDVVVNNAGIADSGPVETIDWARARDVFETNLWGPMRVIRATLPAMRERRSGLVVNVSTVGGRTPARGYHGVYVASKHALGSISEALVWEVARYGIDVVLVEPGFVATAIFHRAGLDDEPEPSPYQADEAWVRRFFLEGSRRLGIDPAEVATAIVDLAGTARPPLHQPVGADAAAGVEAAQRAPSFEAWLRSAIERVATLAGPRPDPPGPATAPGERPRS